MPNWSTLTIGVWDMALSATEQMQRKNNIRRIILSEDVRRVTPGIRNLQVRIGVWDKDKGRVIDTIEDLSTWNPLLYEMIVANDYEPDSIQSLFCLMKLKAFPDETFIFGSRFFYCELLNFIKDEIKLEKQTD
jgi:hypothetical protein